MPIRLADILKDTKTVTFTYEEDEVTVEYRHNALTPVMRIALAAGGNYIRSKRQAATPAKGKGKKGEQPAQADGDSWWQDALAEMQEYLGTVASLIVNWDVLGDDGQPLPVTPALLEQLPLSFINAVVSAMLMDGLPNPRTGENSPGISPPTD